MGVLDWYVLLGAFGLLLAGVGFSFTLWTKDRRTVAIGTSVLAIAILLFASLYMNYHAANVLLEHQVELQSETAERIEDWTRIMRLFIEQQR